ncbi:hypothetical protein LTR78_008436 [Recurvomyces mirabilis]|uniref:AB hydrolase-1 domain-containing protein n=1 Tax=Recurvomyces mirabilis TaxID=574656 RepID=A0AAE0TT89_9PEZI|nr:hypothetical protein LTR78_008436 [Recurvomyces mirabilis]KAK5155424.1 hypothetical protein LTS14_005685 [Recurvomyces mirabilis]
MKSFLLAALLPAFAWALDLRCHQFYIDVSVNATNHAYGVTGIDDDINAVSFALDLSRWSVLSQTGPAPPALPVAGTYRIHVQLCFNTNGVKKDTLQLLTHGLFADKQYWDIQEDPDKYSYVHAALNSGYSVLSHDRLGTGLSDKPDAYNVVQAPLQVEILRTITAMARDGTLQPCANQSSSWDGSLLPSKFARFKCIVHVGHSFGSFLTSGLIGTYPRVSSAAILTGFLPNKELGVYPLAGYGLDYAPQNNPAKYSDRSSGYTVFYHRYNATDPSGFTDALLQYGDSLKQPATVGEFLSTGAINLAFAPAFKGPLEFVVGEYDTLICDGDCKGTYSPEVLTAVYPNASSIDVLVQPGAGHALNFHQNATAGYEVSLKWLASHGL